MHLVARLNLKRQNLFVLDMGYTSRIYFRGADKVRKLSDWLKEEFGEKVYKLSLTSGCTCPNRDGSLGTGGCTFCSEGGSGEFAASAAPIDKQIEEAKARIAGKTKAKRFIAYFQSFTNTYGDPERLRALYLETIQREEIAALSLGTRPDCISGRMLEILRELNAVKPVWVELGLQTIHEETAAALHRGYPLPVFEDCYRRLKQAGLTVIVHVIFGLPRETKREMLETVRYLSGLEPAPDGIKLQMLQVLRGTALGEQYLAAPFPLLTLPEYTDLIRESIRLLPEQTVLHRMTGDGPKKLLSAPLWCADKKEVLNTLNHMIAEEERRQNGKI